jgi:hypothetical protein
MRLLCLRETLSSNALGKNHGSNEVASITCVARLSSPISKLPDCEKYPVIFPVSRETATRLDVIYLRWLFMIIQFLIVNG